MFTPRQEKLADEIIKNSQREKPLNKGEMLEKVGYAESTRLAKSGDIIESEGVQEALVKKGFSIDKAKEVVADILTGEKTKDENKLRAADMIFKVQGGYAPEKHESVNVNINTLDERSLELAKEYEEKLKKGL